jgi:hypothetical protein
MEVSSLPSQFGKPEFYKDFEHEGRASLVVVEMWKGRRWIILYHLQEQRWMFVRRYMCCGPDGFLARVYQEYAPRWLYGASVDGDGGYIVVEKSDHVWFLFYDGDMEYCCLLDTVEIPSLDVVPYPVDQYMGFLLDDNVVGQLREILPILASICEVYLVDTMNERVAYLVEDTGFLRRLFRYIWVGVDWHREGPFEAVDRGQWVGVRQRTTDISGIYEGRIGLESLRIVVEDGGILRWWHTYVLQASEWLFCSTHFALLEDDEDELVDVYDGIVEPSFVEDLDEEPGFES